MATIVPLAKKRVTSQPLPGARVSVDTRGAFGRQEAQAISQLGGTIERLGGQIGQKQEREERRALAIQQEAAKVQERKDKMYANASTLEYKQKYADESITFTGTTRLEADGIADKYKEWHTKAQDDILSRSKTEREKELVRAQLDSEFTKNYVNVKTHEGKQLQLAETELNDSLYSNAVLEAGTVGASEITILDAELTARDALDNKTKGMDAETAKKVKASGMSDFHQSVVEGKIVSDLAFAKEYYKETKNDIVPKEREELRQAIRKETVSQTAQNIADTISATQDDRLTWSSHVEVLTKDKEIQEKARQILDAKKKDEDAHDEELVKRDYLTGLDNVFNAKNLEDGLQKANLIENPENRLKAVRVAESLYARKKRDVETNMTVFAKTLDRINQGEFTTATELLEFYPDLSNADYQKLVNELDSYGKTKQTGKAAEGTMKYSTMKDAFTVALGVKYDVEDEEQNVQFKYAYDKLVDMGITDFDTAKNEIRKFILDGEVRGGLYDPDMTRQEAENTGQLDKWLPDLLDRDLDLGAERKVIVDAFAQDGINENVLFTTLGNDILAKLYKKNTILGLPLSKAEQALYRSVWTRAKAISERD
jgi:hypothetical protein